MFTNPVSRSYRFINRNGFREFLRVLGRISRTQFTALYHLPYVDELCYRGSLCRLRAHQRSEAALEDVLDTVYQYSGCGAYETLAPLQLRSELAAITEYLDGLSPETVVEIGTHHGGTLYTWGRHLDSVETLVSVDVPGGTTPPMFLREALPETRVEFVRGNSHARETRLELERVLDGEAIDVLFVDGDHTLDGVRSDWETYRQLVGEDGVVLFHDIVSIEEDERTDVDFFWDRLAPTHDIVEIVDAEYDPHDPVSVAGVPIVGHGFGVVLNPRADGVPSDRHDPRLGDETRAGST